jgi:hypothetical protein
MSTIWHCADGKGQRAKGKGQGANGKGQMARCQPQTVYLIIVADKGAYCPAKLSECLSISFLSKCAASLGSQFAI